MRERERETENKTQCMRVGARSQHSNRHIPLAFATVSNWLANAA